ncbi:protein GAMETE EXPRESSED 2 isoform X4 [Beta vulgaris subsp. vulgaris]|uniref:protein GAMETE EXPRESSED 2 isoform X4 n=1 Tax=Beta vulgaris subsp. vulgaris TaxID=3555 RepID=UPI002036FF87|nr:protein GAMETE EXPRESSED 2 isoform X4 [Beta vulgaris subsp. vulgaris]
MSSLQMIVSRCLTLPSISLLILTLIIVVDEGPMHPAVSIVSWMDYVNEFVAGTRAMALILPKDALGNTIPSTNAELSSYIFDVSESFVNNSAANSLTVTCLGWNNHGYLQIEFIASSAGDLLLHVQRRNETLRGSPLPFVVHPGPIHVSKCVGKWKYDTNIAQYQSQMEMFIYQLDIYGNLVSDLYSFDAEIVEKSTKLSMPVPDLNFRVSSPGVQLLSFTALEPGNFLLTVYDAKHNTSISNTPYEFIVSIDNCDGSKSIINGSGLNITVAGQEARFSVHLIDAYQYPCPVEMRMLQVQIAWMTDSYMVLPKIYPLEELNGEVNMSLSSVVKYEPKVQKLVRNEVIIQVMDSFYNPVLSQQSKLKVEIGSINHSDFVTWMFVDNNNGSYTGQYQINDTGTFELCATFNGNKFLPCPFGVNVYNSDYFPKAHDDSISVWEDESISFSVLENDYFAGENATVIGFSTPLSGSVLQSGLLFRYTPYKGFYGNDSFSYTICDLNGNSATASVFIAVLSIPPQFFSLPTSLKGSEDVVCPKFGGFHGIEIVYPDSLENVSVTLSANSGTVSLSPMMMQFWEPIWSGLSVRRDGEEAKALSLSGHVEVLNMVLQSMQYLGDENFYGEDTIKVSARNKNGVTDLNVTIFIEPVNDPPFIIIPEHIILEENEGGGSVIYEKTNRFEIGDPDLLHFPGNKSSFLIIFSMEVTSGILEAILPVELVNTTELKLKNSYQWQPLQTFVTISDHLVVKARGLRFQATVDDCNNILKQLIYHDTEYAAILTIVINDMGNYGCFPGCAENISKPLLAEVNINLIKRKPLNSGATHALGFMIILEFLGVVSLGSLLLFYTCRCAISLMNEQRKPDSEKDAAFGNRISGEDKGKVAEKGSVAAGELQSRERPNLRQRSCHQSGHGAFTADGYRSWRGDAKLLPSLSIERSRSAKM